MPSGRGLALFTAVRCGGVCGGRITFGMKEKPLDHKKGTVCDPAQSGPERELCNPMVRSARGEVAGG